MRACYAGCAPITAGGEKIMPPDLVDRDIKVPTGSLPLGNDETGGDNKAKVFYRSRIVREIPSAATSA
jgi:hypothetical protein